MPPVELARIHAAAFKASRGWSADEFANLLTQHGVTAFEADHGFALVRTIADEAELLTIAVHPAAQGQGIGRALMQDWIQRIAATEAFLEVAADNIAAISMYKSFGFAKVGQRKAYYARADAPNVDAIVMRRCFT